MRLYFYKFARILVVLQIFLWFIPEKEITGTVRLVGTQIFPSVVISSNDGKDYYFHKDLFSEFKPYNNKVITIKAKVKDKKTELADGSKVFIIPTIYKAYVVGN